MAADAAVYAFMNGLSKAEVDAAIASKSDDDVLNAYRHSKYDGHEYISKSELETLIKKSASYEQIEDATGKMV